MGSSRPLVKRSKRTYLRSYYSPLVLDHTYYYIRAYILTLVEYSMSTNSYTLSERTYLRSYYWRGEFVTHQSVFDRVFSRIHNNIPMRSIYPHRLRWAATYIVALYCVQTGHIPTKSGRLQQHLPLHESKHTMSVSIFLIRWAEKEVWFQEQQRT